VRGDWGIDGANARGFFAPIEARRFEKKHKDRTHRKESIHQLKPIMILIGMRAKAAHAAAYAAAYATSIKRLKEGRGVIVLLGALRIVMLKREL
jgi:hypothetical protein